VDDKRVLEFTKLVTIVYNCYPKGIKYILSINSTRVSSESGWLPDLPFGPSFFLLQPNIFILLLTPFSLELILVSCCRWLLCYWGVNVVSDS